MTTPTPKHESHIQNHDTPLPREKSFWALDWLRFLLAVYLVLFHTLRTGYGEIGHTWLGASIGLGNLATSVFFVLSGFLLTHAYVVSKKGQPLDRKKFFLARFSTLYPLHIVALLLAIIPVSLIIYMRGGISVPMIPSGPPARMLEHSEFAMSLIADVAMLNAWNPYYLSINAPTWSLSALAFFYLAFPAAAQAIYRSASPARILVMLGILFLLPGLVADALHRTDMVTDGLLHRNPIIRLPLFIAGIALCVLYARVQAGSARRYANAAALVVAATVIVGVHLRFNSAKYHMIRNGLYYPASLAFIWLCVCIRPIPAGALRYWGARLGAASLAIFFLHVPIFSLFAMAEKLVMAIFASPAPTLGAIAATARDMEPSLALYPLYLCILIPLCVLVQERFVMPVQAKIRNMVAAKPVAGLATKGVSAK